MVMATPQPEPPASSFHPETRADWRAWLAQSRLCPHPPAIPQGDRERPEPVWCTIALQITRCPQSTCACLLWYAYHNEEAQVDYDTGPMVRDPHSGKYRRAPVRDDARLQSQVRRAAGVRVERAGLGATARATFSPPWWFGVRGRARQSRRRRAAARHLRSHAEPALPRVVH